MSTIYTDGAGNKYLGDCQWGNHDINYSTTNWLKSIDDYNKSELLTDLSAILNDAGFNDISVAATWPTSNPSNIFTCGFAGQSTPLARVYTSQFNASGDDFTSSAFTYRSNPLVDYYGGTAVDYAMCCGSQSFAFLNFTFNPPYTAPNAYSFGFIYIGKLLDVNSNFSYYTPHLRHVIYLRMDKINTMTPIQVAVHWINGSESLLTTGRAAYTISCSDGQTPGAQWATDMWVYDNNAALGYPVIGRVPNMLLGIGTYTYLKPVKIQGSVFPDGGSPWYLPVGTFSGKVLLMRCYSSVS